MQTNASQAQRLLRYKLPTRFIASIAMTTASASNCKTIRAKAITPHHATDDRGLVNPIVDPIIADRNGTPAREQLHLSCSSWPCPPASSCIMQLRLLLQSPCRSQFRRP
jgi:hypothetical protein